jgi:hypothetical protein
MRSFAMLFGMTLMTFSVIVASNLASAATTRITHQGIVSENGTPLSGSHDFTFRLYADSLGGSSLWSESVTLPVNQGRFTASLGSVTPLTPTVFTTATLWVETEVLSTLLPRQRLNPAHAAIYADSARVAGNAESGGGNPWSTDGTNVWRESGKVGIGTPTPNQLLSVNGMLGIYPRPWASPTTQGMFLYHNPNGQSSIYSFDYTHGHADSLGFAAAAISFDTYSPSNVPSAKMWINQEGRVGIGTTAPAKELDVNGSIHATSIGIGQNTPWTTAYGGLFLDAGSAFNPLVWDNRANCGFFIYQGVGDNIFHFTSTGGGSAESWKWTSAGLGDLFTIASTITANRDVQIIGNLNVTGTKCRAVEGTKYGTLYYNAVESATALFSLEGESKLNDGKCVLELDPKWLAGVTIDSKHPMQVWITFYGQHGEYYVERSMTGFTLIDQSGSNAAFGWKVEARQKGYEDVYLNHVTTTAAK